MESPVTISLIMASYNPGRYLVPAVESVADQLIEGDELLIQDAVSTDGSMDELRARFPDAPWLKIVSEKDKGQADALDRALNRAQNEYTLWLNADDIVYPGALAAMRAAAASGPDLVIGRSTIFTNDGRVVRTYTPREFTREAFIGRGADMFTGSLLYRTELLRRAGGFDAKYEYCMDVDLFARMSELEPTQVHIPDVLAGLRWHEDSKGGSTTWPIVVEFHKVRMEHTRNARERLKTRLFSAGYASAVMVQPLRHSKLYSRLRGRLVGEAEAPVTDVS